MLVSDCQISPNTWSCLATSFAMAFNMPVRDLFLELGHNGSEIIFTSEEPYSRRSFHPQEFIEPALRRGFVIMPIEASPITAGESPLQFYPIDFKEGNSVRLGRYMGMFNGVVTGEQPNRKPHAMYWDKNKFYDPGSGEINEDVDFNIREFFAIIEKGVNTV